MGSREKIPCLTVSYPSPVGMLTLACDESGKHLTGVWIAHQRFYGNEGDFQFLPARGVPLLALACHWFDRYFAGERPEIGELPLAPAGTEYRKRIWKILCGIPYGSTLTYGEVAKKAAELRPGSGICAQAAGGAVGHNPIAIIIPCHRVIGAKGDLTGYGGGLSVKIQLLELEGVDTKMLSMPEKVDPSFPR